MRHLRTSVVIVGLGLFFFIQFFSRIINLLVDWQWFGSVGYFDIFATILTTKALLGLSSFALILIFLVTSTMLATGGVVWFSKIPSNITGGEPITFSGRHVRNILLVISFLLAFLLGVHVMNQWRTILQFIHTTPFGQTDPIFDRDISFYVFTLPVWQLFRGVIQFTLTVALLFVTGSAVLRGHLKLHQAALSVQSTARRHIGLLAILFVLSLAVGVYLARFELLLSQRDLIHGIGFTDQFARIPILTAQIWILIALAISLVWFVLKGARKPVILAASVYVLSIAAYAIYPGLLQQFVVAPNELVKETPFIQHHIKSTRAAYDLEQVTVRSIDAETNLTVDDIAANETTIRNVRLWDREPLLDTFSQIQEIRTYYDFVSIDDDRYILDGKLRQVMLSPRELSPASLPSRNFINEHLIFTHGFGLTFGPINEVTPEGLPVLFVKDIPPQTDKAEVSITRPEIYFGEQSNNYVFINTDQREFNYPAGETNAYTTYEGSSGIRINNLWNKLLLAIKFAEPKILFSTDINADSRILINRQIQDRISTITPFLMLDTDPYMVIANDRLFWIADAYTANRRYPYAQPATFGESQIAYARNAVKMVVDAYNGSVTYYVSDESDPIIQTYAKIFPDVFQPLSEMPEELQPHIRYPTDIFLLQSALYQVYHMQDTTVFYNREDQWDIPQVRPEDASAAQFARSNVQPLVNPRHLVMKLPGEESEEFVLMLPFTPKSKDNMIAWLAARSDGAHYGNLVVYQFPKQKLIFGPKQIINRINQDSEISRQITLWDQRGSQVIQGPLLVIPIEESLLYVRPLYLRAETGKIPELKRVIAAHGNTIAMEETLEQSLAALFGTSEDTQTQQPTQTPEQPQQNTQTELLQQARKSYDTALQAQRSGDWSRYGQEIQQLGEVLQQLQ